MSKERLIAVCDKCLTANCWNGRFMCEDSMNAGIVDMPVSVLAKLKREHPEAWEPGYWEPKPRSKQYALQRNPGRK